MRNEIKTFAEEMEQVMSENDKRKGDSWKEMNINHLLHLLGREYFELNTAVDLNLEELELKELVDIANFCMMIWNRLKEKK